MDMGTCVGCGAEDVEINEDGFCSDCTDLEGGEMNEGGEEENLEEEEG